MKTRICLLHSLVTIASACTLHAAEYVHSWNSGFGNGVVVPDGDTAGWYDSRTIGAIPGPILDVNVTLHLSGGWNGDLYGYLTHGGSTVVLLNRVGVGSGNVFGSGASGFEVVLDDGALVDIHAYPGSASLPLNGIFQPDGRTIAPLSPPAAFDDALRQNDGNPLANFNGMDASGTWTLFLADVSNGEQTVVQSWGIRIEAIPEPASSALTLTGILLLAYFRKSLHRPLCQSQNCPRSGAVPQRSALQD